eukprot:XP_011664841.1 PREDICTED: uncharacterized protein LOC105438565 [Strongylocentrotus purpuratus]
METKPIHGLRYSRSSLIALRHSRCAKVTPSADVLSLLKENGILRYRGCRAGNRARRKQLVRSTGIDSSNVVIDANVGNETLQHVCHWNARSLRHKSLLLQDYVITNEVDVMFVTETWLTENDDAVIAEVTPPGYTFTNVPRTGGRGGGVGALVRSDLKLHQVTIDPHFTTFEHCIITDKARSVNYVAVYRPPPSSTNGLKTSTFLEEFDSFIDDMNQTPGKLLLLGDLNVHYDCPERPDVARVVDTLKSAGLKQYISKPTHRHGHTLDVVIAREDENLLCSIRTDPSLMSDHVAVSCMIRGERPSTDERPQEYLRHSQVVHESDAADVTQKTERKWRKSLIVNPDSDRSAYCEAKAAAAEALSRAKRFYYNDLFSESTPKDMYRELKHLLNKSKRFLPDADSSVELASTFCTFFSEKIRDLRRCIDDLNVDELDNPNVPVGHIRGGSRLIKRSPNKTCPLDPLPTWLLKRHLPVLLPKLTHIINASLASGDFPSSLGVASVTPVLKKPGLDKERMKNYRPISNIRFVAKLMERVVSSQLANYLEDNSLGDPKQSAYRKNHSTETALVSLQNDILCALDDRKCVILLSLDMSSAFDTLDHTILLTRLRDEYGVSGTAVHWFRSYLSNRLSHVRIRGVKSLDTRLEFGVPQGSFVEWHNSKEHSPSSASPEPVCTPHLQTTKEHTHHALVELSALASYSTASALQDLHPCL